MLFGRRPTTPTLFLQWSRPVCRYLICRPGKQRPRIDAVGSFERDSQLPLDEQLKLIQSKHGLKFRHVALLLARPELDLSMLRLPPATEEEIPELVNHLLSQDDDGSDNRASDFVRTHSTLDGSSEILAFACPTSTLRALGQSFKSVNAVLSHVTFSGMGAVHLLRSFSTNVVPVSIVVAMGDEEIDISIESMGFPALFRTISRGAGDGQDIGARLTEEIHRSLSLVGEVNEESTRVFLMGSVDEQREIAEYLTDHLSSRVSVANPLDQVADDLSEQIEHPSRYANLIGSSLAWNGAGLDIDLLHPHHAPKKNPIWRRLAVGSLTAVALLGMLGYLTWEHRAEQLEEIAKYKSDWKNINKRSAKALELQQIVQEVDKWRKDDIIWLDELRSLSEKLPSSDEALIRRINMAVDHQQQGVVDMAVQVKEPETVATLENAVRDKRHRITSKRVTENADQARLPWQFETKITFEPAPHTPLALAAASPAAAGPPPAATPPDTAKQVTAAEKKP